MWVPAGRAMNTEMFFGFVGLWNTLLALPFLVWFNAVGFETFQALSTVRARERKDLLVACPGCVCV